MKSYLRQKTGVIFSTMISNILFMMHITAKSPAKLSTQLLDLLSLPVDQYTIFGANLTHFLAIVFYAIFICDLTMRDRFESACWCVMTSFQSICSNSEMRIIWNIHSYLIDDQKCCNCCVALLVLPHIVKY